MRPSIASLVLVSVTGCLEGDVSLFGCPDDEVCSNDTPNGLSFFGATLSGTVDFGNPPTAIGGHQRVELKEAVGDTFVPLTGFYTAIGGPAVGIESKTGHVITLDGRAPGSNKIEIRDLDGLLIDRKTFSADEIATYEVVGDKVGGSDLPLAFLAGTVRAGVALRSVDTGGGGLRLVDEAMTIVATNGTQVKWDLIEITDAQPGTIQATVNAAGKPPATVDITVVAQVDELVDQLALLTESPTLVVGEGAIVCFDAVSGGTHHVVNLDWTITGDNGAVTPDLFGNEECAIVEPATAGELVVTASAAGLTRAFTYPVAEPRQKPRPLPARPAPSFAGDRALLDRR